MQEYKRQATSDELAALGWQSSGKYYVSPKSGAWYAAEELAVVAHVWRDGERLAGPWLIIESGNPLTERYCERLPSRGER